MPINDKLLQYDIMLIIIFIASYFPFINNKINNEILISSSNIKLCESAYVNEQLQANITFAKYILGDVL